MKSKTITNILLSFIIVFFIGYFLILEFTIKSTILEQLDSVEAMIKDEDWDEALNTTTQIKQNWEDKKYLLILNYAEAEFAMFEEHLNYAIGAAEAEDLTTSLGNILAAKTEFKNATRIVSEP